MEEEVANPSSSTLCLSLAWRRRMADPPPPLPRQIWLREAARSCRERRGWWPLSMPKRKEIRDDGHRRWWMMTVVLPVAGDHSDVDDDEW
ncbi:hypothetical protein Scep_006426 [Stephania cephalantha]|uniref:Uncharacterized protein n=1 Tax=Stephania cephalantha TaxID=152367 RepID=A0AAP0PM77_9MAGN